VLELNLADELGLALLDDLGVLLVAQVAEGGHDPGVVGGAQPGDLEQGGLTLEPGDLLGDALELGAQGRIVRDDADALLQVEGTLPLEVAPDGDPLAGRLAGHAVDEQEPGTIDPHHLLNKT
jgi:hypothetical protein